MASLLQENYNIGWDMPTYTSNKKDTAADFLRILENSDAFTTPPQAP